MPRTREALQTEAWRSGLLSAVRVVSRERSFADNGRRPRGTGSAPTFGARPASLCDAKNRVRADWGPAQLEGYIEQCDRQWPGREWRGVLVQGEPDMAPDAIPRLKDSPYRDRIEVWSLTKGRLGRHVARRLFP